MVKKSSLSILFLLLYLALHAQYPPPAGQPGSTAMYKDSSVFIGWAKTCSEVVRGYIEISDTTLQYNGTNRASYGSILYVSGPPDEYVMSLGDGGSATLIFDQPIGNGPGADFAVFENSFSDTFLELGFVEVSSDGIHFVRFPSVSLTDTTVQVATFGTSDATKINNLAGKYRALYGVPFDLEDLKDSAGINLNHITQVRIVDAVGCIRSPWATRDAQGHKVNDPWPTPFDTGGFDLDAVGVIHYGTTGIDENIPRLAVQVFPNPVAGEVTFQASIPKEVKVIISDPSGRIVFTDIFSGRGKFDLSALNPGIYIARFSLADGTGSACKLIKE